MPWARYWRCWGVLSFQHLLGPRLQWCSRCCCQKVSEDHSAPDGCQSLPRSSSISITRLPRWYRFPRLRAEPQKQEDCINWSHSWSMASTRNSSTLRSHKLTWGSHSLSWLVSKLTCPRTTFSTACRSSMAFARALRLRRMQTKDERRLAVAAGAPVSLIKPHTGCRAAQIILGSAMEVVQGTIWAQ